MSGLLDHKTEIGKTQAGGAFTITVSPDAVEHQISVDITGSPTAGTLTVAARPPGGSAYQSVNGVIDLVNGPLINTLFGHFDSLQFTPSGYDGTSFDVIVNTHKD